MRFIEFRNDLTYTTLGKVFQLLRGSSPRPIINYVTKSSNGVNWIKIGDMPTDSNIVTSTSEKITKQGALHSRAVYVGDIILSNSMSYGKPYILGINGYIHDGWFVIRNYEEVFIKDFLCQLLISDVVQKQYKKIAAGGVVLNISSELVNSVKISIPSKAEQRKIANFLALIDLRIFTQSKIIEKLQSQMKSICDRIFKQDRTAKLTDCVDCHSSSLIESDIENLPIGSYPVYGAIGIIKYVDKYEIAEDSILVLKDGASAGKVQYAKEKHSVLGTSNFLTPKKDVLLPFIYFALLSFNFDKYKVGSGIPHIYFKDYKEEKIYFPTIKEQEQIVTLLSSIEKKIAIELALLEKLREQKKYLLSNMFI